ncbi:bifunctional glycosyltransferase/CDP-glycerol:glycerophosphate glycerophosphotransferase [Brachybacterium subflavum]|uniref:bifunctional glycosyltransferase/CDP-glycerol:glycerophosphate glycerophosphotransferase n=1 Tax=Brachybacterium subflavum TaxID=2585206 RepID=UPI0012666803|nr:glycosyltransferase [Brachybacterium subflavum]
MNEVATSVPRASVIVPIFNVEAYLNECLDSVIAQTIFGDLEVILVDDGSSDRSVEIASRYAATFENMHLIRPAHGGLGAARNNGLRHVTAPLVTFLDSDDAVPHDAYEKLARALEAETSIDIAVGNMETFPKRTEFYWARPLRQKARIVDSLLEVPELVHSASACNKMFRTAMFKELVGGFPEGVHFEDAWVVVPLMLEARSIAIVQGTVYLYRKREVQGSIMDSLFTREQNYWDYLRLVEHLADHARNCMPGERMLIHAFIIRGFQGFVSRSAEVIEEERLLEFRSRARAVLRDVSPRIIQKHSANVSMKTAIGRLIVAEDLAASNRLEIVGHRPHLGTVVSGPLDELLTSAGFTASVESVLPRRGKIVIEGRVTARGIAITEKPRINLSLMLGRRRFHAEWVRRFDRPATEGEWSAFRAVVPADKWPMGEYFPRLQFRGPLGEVCPRVFKTAALFRNSRAFTIGSGRFTIAANHKNQASITKQLAERTVFESARRLRREVALFRDFGGWRLIGRVMRRMTKRTTWLIGERWDGAQDNGAHLFESLAAQPEPGIRPVYVVDRSAPAYRRLKRFGKVAAHGSWRHKFELCRAGVLISPYDVDSYLKPRSWDKSAFLEKIVNPLGIRRVFLQHGVAYRTNTMRSLHRLAMGYDLVVTSSESERSFFSRELGYGRRAVCSGLPRFDALHRIHSQDRKIVLFAPTWRAGLVTPSYRSEGAAEINDSFESSRYFAMLREILESPELGETLKGMGAELRFLPHYEAAEFLSKAIDFSESVRMADLSERSFQEWLRVADIFVTDYSSTMFDAALMGTPVIYYNDPLEPLSPERSGAFFDIDRDGFGPVVAGVEELVTQLKAVAASDFRNESEYQERATRFFGDVTVGVCTEKVRRAISGLVA